MNKKVSANKLKQQAVKASYEHESKNMLKLLNQYLLILAQMGVLFLLIIFLVNLVTIEVHCISIESIVLILIPLVLNFEVYLDSVTCPKEKQWKVQNSEPCLLHPGDPPRRLIFTQMIRCCQILFDYVAYFYRCGLINCGLKWKILRKGL